jgi:hypothetical protein
MSKKIAITESQLKNVVKLVEDYTWDEMLKNYQSNKESEISMSRDDASLLTNLAIRWCEGKDNLPDCKHVMKLHSKHQLFM